MVQVVTVELPGLDCGTCGYRTCDELRERLIVGDILIGRPPGMSCGCPITQCGVATEVDKRTGVISRCVTGPLGPRQHGFKSRNKLLLHFGKCRCPCQGNHLFHVNIRVGGAT